NEVRNIMAAAAPEAAQGFDQGMGFAQAAIGCNPITDILEPMGDTWLIFSDESIAGNGPLDILFVNKLDEPAKAEHGLNALWLAASNMVNGRMQGMPIGLKQETMQDLKVGIIQTPQYSPAWTVAGGKLVIGMNVDPVVKAATAKAPEKGFDQNEK